MTNPMNDDAALLRLMQLASPALPVGAFSYSEGLEYAVHAGAVADAATLNEWIADGLELGAAQLETAVMVRVHDAWAAGDMGRTQYWDAWLTATRETEELRAQGHDMGQALLRLLKKLTPPVTRLEELETRELNFASAFAVAAVHWGITRRRAALAYLQAWSANLTSAGVKLIPLGQTAGQQLLWDLQDRIAHACEAALTVADDDLDTGAWGATLAGMAHETQYTRLFRS